MVEKIKKMCSEAYNKPADTLTEKELYTFIKFFVRDAFHAGREYQANDIEGYEHIAARYEFFEEFIGSAL